MTDLFAHACRLRDAGMAQAEVAQFKSDPEFCREAFAAIERVARRQIHVHVDDIVAEGVRQPKHHNAWGPIWQRAIRLGVIQRSNQVREIRADPKKRGRLSPVYFSGVFDPRTSSASSGAVISAATNQRGAT